MFMRCCSLWQCLVITAFDNVVEAPTLAARTPTLGHKSLLSWSGLACINLQNPADSARPMPEFLLMATSCSVLAVAAPVLCCKVRSMAGAARNRQPEMTPYHMTSPPQLQLPSALHR